MDIENQVLLGACLEILRKIPDNTFDATVMDPPYGIGNRDPKPQEILTYLMGADLNTGGDFMGKDWEIPSVLVWKEIYRVMKPGAHLLCFGGTRTWDLISMGARMAGFEKMPSIAENHAGLQWIQSQGMPKSRNVSKDIDDKLGSPRDAKSPPITPEAQEWAGAGTGLKPTWEPVLVFVKPLSEKTIAANVLKHGTGVIHIDATRVRHSSKADFEDHKKQVEAVQKRGGVRGNSWKNSSDLSGANDVSLLGRWPPDVVFTHSPGCRRSVVQEAVMWVCAEGCPVAELDRQSGNRPSTLTGRADPNVAHDHPGEDKTSKSLFLGERKHLSTVYADGGGISRVFPQFEEDVVPFFYTGKASKREVSLDGEIENDHPTKKPLALMRWLIRLVARKGALILDPYCGSGSTLHAAYEERVRYTGIEKDPHNHEIATKRMAIVQEVVGARQNSQDNFAWWMDLPDDE
jgi:site-specific DNA-methyltransferase (adenine-specific)